jgi:hypothetical protein
MLLPSCEKSLNQTLRSRLASKLRFESKVAPITLTEMTTPTENRSEATRSLNWS